MYAIESYNILIEFIDGQQVEFTEVQYYKCSDLSFYISKDHEELYFNRLQIKSIDIKHKELKNESKKS